MAKLKILKYPNPALRNKAKKVKDPENESVKNLINDMKITLGEAQGMGLAATQVGTPLRICLIRDEENILALINPRIVSYSKNKVQMDEGCLSFPEKFMAIKRPEKIKTRYLNEKGKCVKMKAEGIIARVIQHEIDHLDGILIVDRK